MWQQLHLASELHSNQRETVDWGRKWPVDISARRTNLVSFDQSNKSGTFDVDSFYKSLSSEVALCLYKSVIRPC